MLVHDTEIIINIDIYVFRFNIIINLKNYLLNLIKEENNVKITILESSNCASFCARSIGKSAIQYQ